MYSLLQNYKDQSVVVVVVRVGDPCESPGALLLTLLRGTRVYVRFLDANNAFDRIDH